MHAVVIVPRSRVYSAVAPSANKTVAIWNSLCEYRDGHELKVLAATEA